MSSVITNPGVNITVEGLMPLMFERDPRTRQITACDIGAIFNAPQHAFTLRIEKNGSAVAAGTVQGLLRLDVQNTSQADIRFKLPNEQIDRLTGDGNPQSFNWVLDFEGSEVYNRGIGFLRNQLRPVLRVDRGEFSTDGISVNHLLKRLRPQDQWTLIGKVALKVRIHIDLDQANSEAILFNGDFPLQGTRTTRGEQLDISVQMSRPSHDHGPHSDDANFYHLAIGSGLNPQERLTFKSTPLVPDPIEPPVSPEASCLTGRMDTTPFEP